VVVGEWHCGRCSQEAANFFSNRYDWGMDTQVRTLTSIREQARKSLQGLCQFCQCAVVGVSANAFAGLADARAAFLCASVDSFSTFFLRASNQGVLPFKSVTRFRIRS